MNTYCTLDALKNSMEMDLLEDKYNARLMAAMSSAGRQLDGYCNRHFFPLKVTRTFSGGGSELLLVSDLISVDSSGLKEDQQPDGTFNITWSDSTPDYHLRGLNSDPTNLWGRPYTSIRANREYGAYTAFSQGFNNYQVAGEWGWGKVVFRATETATMADGSTSTLTLSDRLHVKTGHTLLLESEQVYVEDIQADVATVRRGVNGTTGAAHTGGTAIDIIEHPDSLVEACIAQSAHLFKQGQSGYVGQLGIDGAGITVSNRMPTDVKQLLAPFRRPAV